MKITNINQICENNKETEFFKNQKRALVKGLDG
jgi:hypothetical protein